MSESSPGTTLPCASCRLQSCVVAPCITSYNPSNWYLTETGNMESPQVDLNFIESLIHDEVAAIMAQGNITDRRGLYSNLTRSLWKRDSSLQNVYERQVAKSKQDSIWSAIQHNAVILNIQEHYGAIMKDIVALFEKHEITPSAELYRRIVQHIMLGEETRGLLSEEISQEECEGVISELEEIACKGKYQLPLHIKPSASVPSSALEPATPAVPKKKIAPHTPFAQEKTRSIEWVQIFQRHSVLWKFLLSDFCKIEEWASAGIPINQIARSIVEDCKDIPSFNRRLYAAFFFLAKRRLNLSPFVDALVECFLDNGTECEQYSLKFFLNLLLSNCDKLVRQKLIHLISASNPIPVTELVVAESQTSFTQSFTPELYWILDDKFLFFSIGIGNCKGKSSLLNRIFGTSFEISKDSEFFKGTVDYQSDSSTVPHRGMVVADGHGVLASPFKHGLFNMADGVIMHVHNDLWENDLGLIRDEIEAAAQSGARLVVVLVRDAEEPSNSRVLGSFLTQDSSLLGLPQGETQPVVLIFKLPSLTLDDMVDYYVRTMREKIMECLWSTFGLSAPSFNKHKASEVQIAVKKGKKDIYLTLLSAAQKGDITAARAVLDPMLSLITRTVQANQAHETSFLPVYSKFKAMYQLRNSLITRFGNAADTHIRRVLVRELAEEIKQTDVDHPPEAIVLFEKMISAKHNSIVVMEFVEALKKIVDEATNNAESTKHVGESRSVSVELFWREINQLFLLGRSSEQVLQAFQSFVLAGEPFELLDGDNMYFPFQFLYNSLKDITTGKRVLTISAIGAQSSGKSTLLNYMFGCNLIHSEARITKGIYGTVMESPIEGYDLLVILDTEGLHSARPDHESDRKLVLCMLAICDVVIVTARDQEDEISKTLEGCAKALTSLHNAKVPQPIAFFVQNLRSNQYTPQPTQIDIIANLAKEGLSDTFSFSTDNFVALPSAFLSKEIPITGADRWQKLITLPKFVEKVAAFTDTLFTKVSKRQSDFVSRGINIPHTDLPTWLRFAHNTFLTICKFDDLTRYGDLVEESQDQFVRKWLHIVVDNVISVEKKHHIFAMADCIASIETYFSVASAALQHELVDMLEKNQIKATLHKTHLDTLKVLMENARANWTAEANVQITNEKYQHEFTNGHHRINDKIREVVRSEQKYTREQLHGFFEACYEESLDEIFKRHVTVETSINKLCMSVINIYKLYCPDLPNSEELSELDICLDPEARLQQILEYLETSNYEDMVYMLPVADALDWRLMSGVGYKFVNGEAVALMKEGLLDYLIDHPTDINPADHVISNSFTEKPIAEKIKGKMHKLFTTAKCAIATRPFPNNLSPSKTALLLVQSIKQELRTTPRLIAKLVNIALPLDMVRSRAQEEQTPSRLASTDAIHRCINYVNEGIIAPFDADLRAFGIALTKSMRSRLHMLMLQYLVTYTHRFLSKMLEEPSPNELRDSWRATFIEQTLRGPARDIASVDMLITKLEDSLQPYCIENARSIFAATMENYAKTTTRSQLQLQFERDLTSKSKEELLRYVTNPALTLQQQFERGWRQEEAKMLEQAQQVYTNEGNSLQPLERWTAEVYRQIESAKFSLANDIFRAPGGARAVEALLNKEKAVVLLYWDLLRGRRNMHYTVDGMDLDVVDWDVASASDGVKAIKNLELLIKLVVSVGTISDLMTFAQRVAERVNMVSQALRKHQCSTPQLDPTTRFALARDRAAGCNQLCPCCKRCCDEEHWKMLNTVGTGPNRHKCRFGHQYRGMAGFAFETTKFASLNACGDLQENDRVWLTDRYVTWREFKAKYPSWDFNCPVYIEKGLESSRKRMAYIWSQVGQELCEEFGIQYTSRDQSYAERTKHFVFLVGATLSMEQNWQCFLRAGQKFSEIKLAQDPSVSHLASLVLFSHSKIHEVFHECVFTPELFPKDSYATLPFTGEKTSFSVALEFLCNLLEKETRRVPTVVVIISDGDDAFPQKELHNLCEDHIRKHIDSFWCVAFGAKAAQGTLMGMAQWMEQEDRVEKSNFRNPKDFSELVDHCSEIAKET